MPNGIPQDDAFAGGTKRESLSFKNAPVGTAHTGTVIEKAKLVQSTNYDTGKPDFWDDGNPKMSAVFAATFNGEERSVWAPKPSSLYSAFAAAQQKIGRPMEVGDQVTITFVREEVNPDPVKAKRQNPKKIYEVEIKDGAGDAFSEPDF